MQVTQSRFVYAITAYLLTSWCLGLPMDKEKQVTCKLGDEVYNVNDTWHPMMNTVGDRNCVNCTCMPNGEVNCVAMSCPKPTCEEPRLVEGECCVTCDVQEGGEGGGGGPPNGEEGQEKGCVHHGRSYSHLEVFPSNYTSLKPQNDSQCVMCNCYDGKVMCLVQLCLPNPACKKLISVEDDCCKRCEDDPGHFQDNDVFGLPRKDRTLHLAQGACWWHRTRKENGTTWNPVVAGVVSCVSCTCLDGDVTCDRKDCPRGTLMPCPDTDQDEVCDCEACPKEKSNKRNNGKRKGKKKKKSRKRKKKCTEAELNDPSSKKKCSGGKRRRKKSKALDSPEDPSAIFKADMKLNDVIHQLCMPQKSDFVMYHIKGDTFEAVAFDGPGRKSIQDIRWKIKRGRLRGDPQKNMILDLDNFRRDVTVVDIVGAVKKNQIKRFLKIMEKRRRRCKKPCRRKLVARLVKKVKSTKLDLSKACTIPQ